MSQWNILPSKEVLGEHSLTLAEMQELLLSTYVEEQDKWNKDVLELEQEIMKKEKEIRELNKAKDKWFEQLLCMLCIRELTSRQETLLGLQDELDTLHNKYLKRVTEMPNIDRYEFGMFDGKLFKGK